MAFAEINDPKGQCKDVTNLGRWGNGDVKVGLKSLDELPYIMGLVRQSSERQNGRRRPGMTWPQQEEDLAKALDEAPFADRLTRLNLGKARKTAKGATSCSAGLRRF